MHPSEEHTKLLIKFIKRRNCVMERPEKPTVAQRLEYSKNHTNIDIYLRNHFCNKSLFHPCNKSLNIDIMNFILLIFEFYYIQTPINYIVSC